MHELVVYKMAEGVPYSVAESVFLAPSAASPGGMEEMPGDHFTICFIPDFEIGAPPFALGMIEPFAVA